MLYNLFWSTLLLLVCGCSSSKTWQKEIISQNPYFLVIYVDAPHFDYSSNLTLLKGIAKHPRDGCKEGSFGHAWIYLQGILNGESVYISGGHSGELGIGQPKYFDGVMDYVDVGDKNPIRYLWTIQKDGFFQWGSGGHTPSTSVMIPLTEQKFLRLWNFIQEEYDYSYYSLIDHQCCTFVAELAALIGISLQYEITIPISSTLCFRGAKMCLWTNPQYSFLKFGSPDKLENSLLMFQQQLPFTCTKKL